MEAKVDILTTMILIYPNLIIILRSRYGLQTELVHGKKNTSHIVGRDTRAVNHTLKIVKEEIKAWVRLLKRNANTRHMISNFRL